MPDADLSATLAEIRQRRANSEIGGFLRPTLAQLDASAEDVPRLLAALEAVLKLTGEWNALWPCATQVREAITAELTGKEAGNDRP